jgi:hypothetical protein
VKQASGADGGQLTDENTTARGQYHGQYQDGYDER